ncbi:MAG: Stp1/IreP family PP2C-type Ser/Thr phosphatase [Pseudomonadota bacterium]
MNVEHAIKVARLTDVGLHRDHNEDAVASDLSIGLLVLADGMGGYNAGEVASEIAVLTLAAEITEAMRHKDAIKLMPGLLPESQMLMSAIEKANATIYQISQKQPQCAGMGTTLVAGIFTDNKLVVGHIGDSRLYCLRHGSLIQVTEDHSLLQEQLNSGLITIEQAKVASHKNLVTRALGIDPEVEPEVQEIDVEVGDLFLLCSDGLTDMVEDDLIEEILLNTKGNVEKAAAKLVQTANESGGKDNISVVIATIEKSFSAENRWVKNLFGRAKN